MVDLKAITKNSYLNVKLRVPKMKEVILLICLLGTTFPSVIGSPKTLQDDDYDLDGNNDGDDYEEEKDESSWSQPSESKAQFQDKNQTIEVAEGSIARLYCRVDNRDQDEQIMWYALDEQQKENMLAICSVIKDVNEDERKDPCISMVPKKDNRNRFRDEGQRLTISNVTKEDDGKIYKCSLALGKETNPSIFLRLVVHPPDWKEMKTTPNLILPRLTDDVQNLPSTGTSEDMSGTANGIEKSSFYKLISLGFLAYHLHWILPR